MPPASEGSQIPLGKTDAYKALTEGVNVDHLKPEAYADYVKAGRLVARELGLEPGHSALVVHYCKRKRVKSISDMIKI